MVPYTLHDTHYLFIQRYSIETKRLPIFGAFWRMLTFWNEKKSTHPGLMSNLAKYNMYGMSTKRWLVHFCCRNKHIYGTDTARGVATYTYHTRETHTHPIVDTYNEYDTAFRHSTDGSFVVHPDHEVYQIHSHSHTNGGVDDGTYHAIPTITFQESTYDYNHHNDIRCHHNHQQLGLQSQQYKSYGPPSE